MCDDFVNLDICQLGLGLSEILIGIGCVCGGGVIGPVWEGVPVRPGPLAWLWPALAYLSWCNCSCLFHWTK